nr:broad protein isoform ZFe [Pseudothemis zonata]
MVDTQHFCLRWNNYQSSITSAFENLRDDEDFVDVTLACEGKSLKAHRVVLSACSPYFRELLKSTPCKHPVIVLQDVAFADLHALVEFIYHGEVNVHQRSLTSFLKTAEVLRVSGLTQQADYRDEGSTRNHQGFPPEKLDDTLFSPPSPLHPHPPHSHTRRTANQRRDVDHSSTGDFDKYDHSGVPAKRLKPEECVAVGSSMDGESGVGVKVSRNSPVGEEGIKTEPAEGSGTGGVGAVGGGDGEGVGEDDEDEDDDNSINSVEGPPLENPMVPSGNQLSSSEDHDGGPGGGTLVPNPYYLSIVPDSKGPLYPPPPSQQPQSTAPFRFDMTSCMSDPGSIAGIGNQNMKGMPVDGSAGTSTQGHSSAAAAAAAAAAAMASAATANNNSTSPKRQFFCLLCGKMLCSKASLKRHVADKHEEKMEEFRCAVCERTYCSRNSLMTHIYTYHKSRPSGGGGAGAGGGGGPMGGVGGSVDLDGGTAPMN